MISPDTKLAMRHPARRRLLRGAFAAPAVLTVYSGSALATTSNLRCLAYQAGTNATQGVTTGVDVWVRVPLYPMLSNASRFWIKGSDVVAKFVTGHQKSSFIASTAYWEFNPTTNLLVGTTSTAGDPGLGAATKWASLRFDALGNITGIGSSGSGAAMPGTCWVSAAPFV